MPYVLRDDEYAQFTDLLRWWKGLRGAGVVNRPGVGVTVLPPSTQRTRPQAPRVFETYPVKVVSPAGGSGIYNAQVGFWKDDLDPDSDYVLDNVTDFTNPSDCYLENQPESERINSHRITNDTIVVAWALRSLANDGKPRYAVNYNHAVRDLRLNTTNDYVEVTFVDAQNLTDDDWVQKIPVSICSGTSLAEFSGF